MGDDTLTGGERSDTFVFADVFGHDVITDFNEAEDKLEFSGTLSEADLIEGTDADGNRTLTTSNGANSITFKGGNGSGETGGGSDPNTDLILSKIINGYTVTKGADLSGADLSGDLSNMDLSGINLADANLTGTNFSGPCWITRLLQRSAFQRQILAELTQSPSEYLWESTKTLYPV